MVGVFVFSTAILASRFSPATFSFFYDERGGGVHRSAALFLFPFFFFCCFGVEGETDGTGRDLCCNAACCDAHSSS